jgi:hypothetical protein
MIGAAIHDCLESEGRAVERIDIATSYLQVRPVDRIFQAR